MLVRTSPRTELNPVCPLWIEPGVAVLALVLPGYWLVSPVWPVLVFVFLLCRPLAACGARYAHNAGSSPAFVALERVETHPAIRDLARAIAFGHNSQSQHRTSDVL